MSESRSLTPSLPQRLLTLGLYSRVRLREEDKQKHIGWSFALMLASSLLLPVGGALAAVFALGLVKECWDQRYGSGFCLWDILANIIGLFLASVVFFLLSTFVNGMG